MPLRDPVTDTGIIDAETAQGVCQQEIDRCTRRITAYSEKIAADPKEAVVVSADLARYGFSLHIWEMAMQVALGNRTLQSFEASLSARLLSLCNSGDTTATRMVTERLEMAMIEDALDQSGAIGVLKRIQQPPEETRMISVFVPTTMEDASDDLAQEFRALIDDEDRIATFSAYLFPNLIGEDARDRRDDTKTVLEGVIALLSGQVNV